MDSLSTWLSKQQTFPSITQLFIARLTAWPNRQEVTFPEPDLNFLATAYREQTNIGWYKFLQGCISNDQLLDQNPIGILQKIQKHMHWPYVGPKSDTAPLGYLLEHVEQLR
jgi:hypothetical protein